MGRDDEVTWIITSRSW